MPKHRRKRRPPKRSLAPDLDQTKSAVLNSLTSKSGQRTYDHAINEFVDWYSAKPRLAFNRTVVLRYRIHLELRHLAATTINLRLAAVRRVAYEAADSGLLSPELAVGIRRVKGVRRIGVRLGNWLTVDQGRSLLLNSHGDGLRSRRNYAILALLIGCGLRRGELLAICLEAWNCLNSDKASVARYRQSFAVRLIASGTWDVILNRVWRILVQVLTGLLSVGTEIR